MGGMFDVTANMICGGNKLKSVTWKYLLKGRRGGEGGLFGKKQGLEQRTIVAHINNS